MGKLWQTLQAIMALGRGAWTILGLLGWQHLAIALIVSVAGGIFARLQGTPLSLVIMAAFPVFVACLYLLELPAFIKGTTEIEGQRLPDPELWKAMDRYSLGQAACLMANVQPVNDTAFMPKSAMPIGLLLVQGVRNGTLPAHTPHVPEGQPDPLKTGQSPPNWYHVVMRKDLQNFWEKSGLKLSKFLKD